MFKTCINLHTSNSNSDNCLKLYLENLKPCYGMESQFHIDAGLGTCLHERDSVFLQ